MNCDKKGQGFSLPYFNQFSISANNNKHFLKIIAFVNKYFYFKKSKRDKQQMKLQYFNYYIK